MTSSGDGSGASFTRTVWKFFTNGVASGSAGAAGGILAGLVNGAIILGVGKFAEITEKFGAPSQGFAFFMHMFFCTLMGTSFGVLCDRLASSLRRSVIVGVIYSVGLGLFAVFVIMPLRFGEQVPLTAQSLQSTAQIHAGHALFGLILGFVYPTAKRVMRRRSVQLLQAGCVLMLFGFVAGFLVRGRIRLPSGPLAPLAGTTKNSIDENSGRTVASSVSTTDAATGRGANDDGAITKDDMSGVPSVLQDLILGGQDSIQKDDRTDRIFGLRDLNKDGQLSASELPGPFKKILTTGDLDGDGLLSRTELSTGMDNGLLLEIELPAPLKAMLLGLNADAKSPAGDEGKK